MHDFLALVYFTEIELRAGELHVRSGTGEGSVQADQADQDRANYTAHRQTPGLKSRQIKGPLMATIITQDFAASGDDFAPVKKLTSVDRFAIE
jgi:hypothetical protein